MKKLLVIILSLATLLASCAAPNADTESTQTASIEETSENVSSDELVESSEEASSEETSSEEPVVSIIKEIDGISYYDAKAAGADKKEVYVDPFTKIVYGDHSEFFPEDAEGYYIDDMLFLVDEETFYRILSKPCLGTGSIKWVGFNENVSWHGDMIKDGEYYVNDGLHGILPVEKFNDPLYVYMCKPSERVNFMGNSRINAGNMSPAEGRFVSALTIGAIYANVEKEIPDDAEFTICLGRTTLIYYTEEKGWYIEKEWETPAKPNSLYYLPWDLEWRGVPPTKLSDDLVTLVDGHYEIKMTGAMLKGKYGKGEDNDAVEGAVLHFWSPKLDLTNGADIKAVCASYECWIKEPEWAEYVTAEIAVDWRDGDGEGQEIYQAFAGHNYAITTEPRVIFGHTAGPDMYDEVMDTELVQKLLGLKKDTAEE